MESVTYFMIYADGFMDCFFEQVKQKLPNLIVQQISGGFEGDEIESTGWLLFLEASAANYYERHVNGDEGYDDAHDPPEYEFVFQRQHGKLLCSFCVKGVGCEDIYTDSSAELSNEQEVFKWGEEVLKKFFSQPAAVARAISSLCS
jgi:hypothetical protein